MDSGNGLIEAINNLWGGMATTLLSAGIGRLMWHSGEVKMGNRRFFGKELIWEIPVAFGMAIIGEAVSSYLMLEQPASTGVIATLAYLGPRGTEAVFQAWRGKK